MNLALIAKLLDQLMSEGKGKGRGRNLNRVGVFGLVLLVWLNTRDNPAQFQQLNSRMAKVEGKLGIEPPAPIAATGLWPTVTNALAQLAH